MRVKINVFCGDQRRVGRSKKTAALQSKAAGQIGELFVYDVVVSEFFLISLDVFDVNGHVNALVTRKMQLSIKLSVVFKPTYVSYLLVYFSTSLSLRRFTCSCVNCTQMASLALPVDTSTASCSRRAGMSGPGVVKLVKSGTILPAGPLDGSASSRFITSAYASCSAIVYWQQQYIQLSFFSFKMT